MDGPPPNQKDPPWFTIHLSTLIFSAFIAYFFYWIQGAFAWRSGAIYWGWPYEAYANNFINDSWAYTKNLTINLSVLSAFSLIAEMLARRSKESSLNFQIRSPNFRKWLHPSILIPCILVLGLLILLNSVEYPSKVGLYYGDPEDPWLSSDSGERDVKGWPKAYRQSSRTPGNSLTYFDSEALVWDFLAGLFFVLLAGVLLERQLKASKEDFP